jgi:hypothetical protein
MYSAARSPARRSGGPRSSAPRGRRLGVGSGGRSDRMGLSVGRVIMAVVESMVMITCPVCRAWQRRPCVKPGDGSKRRVPHWRRAALALARRLMSVSMQGTDPVLTAEVYYWDLDPRTWAPGSRADLTCQRQDLDDLQELAAYQAAGCLQDLVGRVLDALNERTLNLMGLSEQCETIRRALAQARDSTQLLQEGLTRPEDATLPTWGLPSPDEAQVWAELGQLAQIRDRMRLRDQTASLTWPGATAQPWHVEGPLANGIFTATRNGSLKVHGWAETPEAIADALRAWSTPGGAPVTLAWEAPPRRPVRRLPFGGWRERHPANVGGLEYFEAALDLYAAWDEQLPKTVAAFAAAIDRLRRSWSANDDLAACLRQAAEAINNQEPQAPTLGCLIRSGFGKDLAHAVTMTTEWLDPATIAHSGLMTWNGFGSHRPEQPKNFTRALLACTDPAQTATESWGIPEAPVSLHRVPGPAGPLYELAHNGMHRIHTARMLHFPLLWAVVTQYPLPLEITWWDLADSNDRLTPELKESFVTTWQGLLSHRLLTGDLDADEGVLRPSWVATPWLLSRPQHAILWARNYERAYPRALHRLGIPTAASQTPRDWQAWLAQTP